MVKPEIHQPIDGETYERTVIFFEELMLVIHPFLPFITEEVWQVLRERKTGESIMVSRMPDTRYRMPDRGVMEAFEFVREVITAVRGFRKEHNIPPKKQIRLLIKKNLHETADKKFDEIVRKFCGISELIYVDEKQPDASSIVVRTTELYIPLSQNLNVTAEVARLNQELEYTRGFLETVRKKLTNENFLNNAPQKVIDIERKKQKDAQSRMLVLEKKLKELR